MCSLCYAGGLHCEKSVGFLESATVQINEQHCEETFRHFAGCHACGRIHYGYGASSHHNDVAKQAYLRETEPHLSKLVIRKEWCSIIPGLVTL